MVSFHMFSNFNERKNKNNSSSMFGWKKKKVRKEKKMEDEFVVKRNEKSNFETY